MLFRPVYGSELAAIHRVITKSGTEGIPRSAIYSMFVPGYIEGHGHSTQNVDDALAFLYAAHLAQQETGAWRATPSLYTDFRIQALAHLRQLQLGSLAPHHPADVTYMLLLEELYAKPGQRLVRDLHVQANRLEAVQAIGGLNREKLQGWRRVLCFLGMGVQIHGVFIFAPEAMQVMAILRLAPENTGSLQTLFEGHLNRFIPCFSNGGHLTSGIETCLEILAQTGHLQLFVQQDSPARPYGRAGYRGYTIPSK